MSPSAFRSFFFDWLGSQKEGEKKRLPVSSLKGKCLAARVRQAEVDSALCSVFILHIPTKSPWFKYVTPVFSWVWFLPFHKPSGICSLSIINFRSTELGRGALLGMWGRWENLGILLLFEQLSVNFFFSLSHSCSTPLVQSHLVLPVPCLLRILRCTLFIQLSLLLAWASTLWSAKAIATSLLAFKLLELCCCVSSCLLFLSSYL